MKKQLKATVICSIIYHEYRLELVESVTGELWYKFWIGSMLRRRYSSPDIMVKAISLMGSYMLEALNDLEREEKNNA